MKKIYYLICLSILFYKTSFSQEFSTSVTFPANYQIGSYIEFAKLDPYGAGSAGYYEVSILYTRNNLAAAATHLVSIAHANPALWREAGRINNNVFVSSTGYNFTIDANTQYGNARLRVRAVNTLGTTTDPLVVYIKVRSINQSGTWTPLNTTGNDLTVNKFLPMTNDWSLYVGNLTSTAGANLAIRAIENGNVGIGTTIPSEKLSVNGKIRAREVKVETVNWPDFVFSKEYALPDLKYVEKYIAEKGHLPEIPSAFEVEKGGLNLGEMNAKLLQKIEELTLYMIEFKKENELIKSKLKQQQEEINLLYK